MPLERAEYLRDQTEIESGVLYFRAEKEGVLLFCAEQRYPVSVLLKNHFRETKAPASSLRVPYDDSTIGLDETRAAGAAERIFVYTAHVWNAFTQMQNEILELILSQKSIEEIMKKVQVLLRRPFIIVDRNMLSLYQHPDIAVLMKEELGENYAEEIMEELFLAKEFHEAAKKRDPFYYWMNNVEEGSYCINIVADGYYYARLVVYLDKGSHTLSSGEEQIAEYIATVIVQMIRSGTMQLHYSDKDLLHTFCHRLLDGHQPDVSEICAAVESYHWEMNHRYQVLCLEPYHAVGWDTQIENTMPQMTGKLEKLWKDSCAVFSGKHILWILYLPLSEGADSVYERSQKLMVFLRENVFRAGASSYFRDASLFASAMKEAEAALLTGTKKTPSYWYYRFDDFRMAYMTNAIMETGIDPMLLIHPAIPVLMEYDSAHESELTNTLRIFLEKRQNVTQTAKALFIHRTTLFRWLNQIRELTGLDFENTEEMLELEISYRILAEQ